MENKNEKEVLMGYIYRIGNKCMSLNCSCCQFDNKSTFPLKEGATIPPLHDGCDCYLVEDRNDKEANMQSVEEGKARLIVKRIVADMVRDQSVPLGCEWESLNAETREAWVSGWIKIASEVLGEEVEPLPWQKVVEEICKAQGYEDVMAHVAIDWMVEKGDTACTMGPPRLALVNCNCEEPTECEWCCGAEKLTHRVKQAKQEAEAKTETDEQEKPPLSEVQAFSMYSSWAEHFVRGMEGLGATKVSVPMSPNGSIAVEFERGKPIAKTCPDCGKEMLGGAAQWSCISCGHIEKRQ